VAVQGVTAEARLLAQPVSFELVTTTHAEGIEERMTMAPLSARRLAEMVDLGERILAIELLIACQAADLRAAEPLGAGTKRAYDLVREVIPFMDVGDAAPADLEPIRHLVRSGGLSPSSP
jgi:histidine ammonia-lyase